VRTSSHPQPGPKTRTPHGPLREGGISTCNESCRRVQTVPEFPELPFGDPRRLSFLTMDLAILVRVQVSQPFFSRARKRQLRVLRLLCSEHANPLLIPELPKPDRRTQIVHASEVSESVPGNYETAVLRLAAQLDSAGLRWRQGRPSRRKQNCFRFDRYGTNYRDAINALTRQGSIKVPSNRQK